MLVADGRAVADDHCGTLAHSVKKPLDVTTLALQVQGASGCSATSSGGQDRSRDTGIRFGDDRLSSKKP
jgi:hypothetical protein